MGYIKKALLFTLFLFIWFSVAMYGGLSGWWVEPIAEPGKSSDFMDAALGIVEEQNQGDVAFVLLKDGKVFREYYSTKKGAIDENTLFPMASVSKWITAYGVMKLVKEGKLNLDEPVSSYLTRWRIPEGKISTKGVTVRALLSHTAGLSDRLGFGDYAADETLPSLEGSLNAPRASSGEEVKIVLGYKPGTDWQYSGGGYLILQLLVEEVTGYAFADYMQQSVFEPLGMLRTTYQYLGNQENRAGNFDQSGNPVDYRQYAANAATGLSSSPADLIRFIQAQISDKSDASLLPRVSVESMRESHGRKLGADIWGLGTMLYAPVGDNESIFGHDGMNEPGINTAVRINPVNNNAMIALTTGSKSLAAYIGYHWVLWETGQPDHFAIYRAIDASWDPFLTGAVILAVLFILLMFFFKKRSVNK